MPKAKPISLYPLSFDEALTMILKASPKQQKKLAMSFKPHKRKTS